LKRVAVLGGGPAGAVAAERLAAAGLNTVIVDEKLAWEKPCGGGITYKAYQRYPFLIDNEAPKRFVKQTFLTDPKGGSAGLKLTHPVLIYSRLHLNGMLLSRAEKAGAQIEKERVLGIERRGLGWQVRTRAGKIDADYCVIATGARNSLRDVGTRWAAHDAMCALGYWAHSDQDHIDIQFFPQFEGYLWVFPRCGHLSVGICGKGEPSSSLRARLEEYMREREIPTKDATFYGHLIPSLEQPAWRANRVAGDGWMAVGDAAGFVDPVTGEGLYYAVRSGDLASQVILSDLATHAERAAAYREQLHADFIEDLTFASSLAKRFFCQSFLFGSVPARMIELIRRSPKIHEVVQDLFAGTQQYLDLKQRLLTSLNGTMLEVLRGRTLGTNEAGIGQA
jgi:geranylgeranyl reductase family protein